MDRIFDTLDVNADGTISQDEMRRMFVRRARRDSTLGIWAVATRGFWGADPTRVRRRRGMREVADSEALASPSVAGGIRVLSIATGAWH